MSIVIRQTDIRECDLCDGQAGAEATVFEIWDDKSYEHRLLFMCKRHAQLVHGELTPMVARKEVTSG